MSNYHQKIDEINVILLKNLLNDPRKTFTEIANECNVSTNAILTRFKKLKKTGVITGAIMQIDPRILGYNCTAQLDIQTDANQEITVSESLREIPGVLASFQPIGKFNIVSYAALKTVDELASTIEQIKSLPYVKDVGACILVDIIHMDHPENLIIKPLSDLSNRSKFFSKKENKKTRNNSLNAEDVNGQFSAKNLDLDDVDLSIISIVSENASLSFRKIAKKVGVSTQSVIRRYNKVRKTVLPYASITLDLRKLGYIGTVFFNVTTSQSHKKSTVFNRTLQIPNVILAYKCLGRFDFLIGAPFANVEQIFNLKHEISKTSGVKDIEVVIDKPFSSWPFHLFAQLIKKRDNQSKNTKHE